MPDLQPDYRPGDVLLADVVNELIDARIFDVRGGPGLTVRKSGRNVQIANSSSETNRLKMCVVSSGGLTARVGNVMGTGNVELYTVTPGTTTAVDSSIEIKGVLSFSSTTGGIPSGTYGFLSWDDDGNPWFTSADCGN